MPFDKMDYNIKKRYIAFVLTADMEKLVEVLDEYGENNDWGPKLGRLRSLYFRKASADTPYMATNSRSGCELCDDGWRHIVCRSASDTEQSDLRSASSLRTRLVVVEAVEPVDCHVRVLPCVCETGVTVANTMKIRLDACQKGKYYGFKSGPEAEKFVKQCEEAMSTSLEQP